MQRKSREADDSRVRRRRQQVVNASVGLFLERDYSRTTVQEIANQAGVSAGLIYQYFTDQLVMLAHTWALKHWRLVDRYTLEQYIQTCLSFYLSGCLTAAGYQRLCELEMAG